VTGRVTVNGHVKCAVVTYMKMKKFFISYSRVDEIRVADLVDILRQGGFEPWWDDRLELGDDWKKSLEDRIAECEGFVCVISPDSVASEWCQWEMAQASELSKPVFPVLIRAGAVLPPVLARLHYLDASEGFNASVAARLVGKLASSGQKSFADRGILHRVPRGVPARLSRTLPTDYRTLAQAYFQPFGRGVSLYKWPNEARIKPERQGLRTIPGIDFGTTESSIAVCTGGAVTLIPNRFGETSTSSAVAIAPDGTPLVGAEAIELLLDRPERGVLEVKRLLGAEAANGPEVLVIDGIAYSAIQLAGFLLRQLRLDAEKYLDAEVSEVVLAAPAYFGPDQYAALTEAATLAGLKVVRIIPEPIAACMAVAHDRDRSLLQDETWMIYDLGGGTFDASIVEFAALDGESQFEVLAVNGDTQLGGADYDRVLVEHCVAEFFGSTGIELNNDPAALMRIRRSVERAKIALSCDAHASVRVSALALTVEGEVDLHVSLSQQLCTELTQHLTAETLRLTRTVLADAGKIPQRVDKVLVVGRAARAAGVAVGLQDLFSQGLHYAVDHVVALGAATQGGVLSGYLKDALLLDAITRTLRLEAANGQAVPIIPRNRTIPWRENLELRPSQDAGHPTVIRVLAGESSWPARNTVLVEISISSDRDGQWPWTLKLDIDTNLVVHLRIYGKDGNELGRTQFGLRQARAQPPMGGKDCLANQARLPRLANAITLSPVRQDICTDKIALRRWLARAATDLVLARVGPGAKGGWWLALGDWLDKHPSGDVSNEFAKEIVFNIFSMERELLLDALEQQLGADLRSVRAPSSVETLAAALNDWWLGLPRTSGD
jgi:molecular chaperone DnaK